MRTKFYYLDQLKDEYGNLLSSWGAYEKTLEIDQDNESPKENIKLLKQFESIRDAQEYIIPFLNP